MTDTSRRFRAGAPAARWRLAFVLALALVPRLGAEENLRLAWEENILSIRGPRIPGDVVKIWYLEAYCRPGSTDRDWTETVIGHDTKLVSRKDDGSELRLRCKLRDGVIVDHTIRAAADSVDFRIEARNPTETKSLAHWAQPCMRVGEFTGTSEPKPPYAYVEKSFLFLDGKLTRMPTDDWATEARYVPGQVWAAPGVDRDDVNPRPLNPRTPSNGLIGCFSADESMILAIAFEPYQELFQGVIRCLHSDFRLGGLEPGERKTVRGKLYIVEADVSALLKRYERDFPKPANAPDDGSEDGASEKQGSAGRGEHGPSGSSSARGRAPSIRPGPTFVGCGGARGLFRRVGCRVPPGRVPPGALGERHAGALRPLPS